MKDSERRAEIAMCATRVVNNMVKSGYTCKEIAMFQKLVKASSELIANPEEVSRGVRSMKKRM